MEIGNKIKNLRLNAKMNQTELSKKLNITQASLSSYENNNVLPSIDILLRIANFFNVSLDWLCSNPYTHHFVTGTDIIDLLLELKEIHGFEYKIITDDFRSTIIFDQSEKDDSDDFTQSDLAKFLKEYSDLVKKLDTLDDADIKKNYFDMWIEKKRKEYSHCKVEYEDEYRDRFTKEFLEQFPMLR